MTWRCDRCDAIYETNDPPCDTCGNEELVSAARSEPATTVTSFVWACTECGREHVKNSPPCSRCGHPMLERREPSYDEPDTAAASYLSVARPYFPVAALLGIVVVVAASGIVPIELLPGHGPPSPPDAPGDGEVAAGIDLTVAEDEIYAALEAERAQRDSASRAHDEELRSLATYLNRQQVLEYAGGDPGGEVDPDGFDLSCSSSTIDLYELILTDDVDVTAYDDGSDLADAVVSTLLADDPEQERVRNAILGGGASDGIDLHVYDDDVFVTYLGC